MAAFKWAIQSSEQFFRSRLKIITKSKSNNKLLRIILLLIFCIIIIITFVSQRFQWCSSTIVCQKKNKKQDFTSCFLLLLILWVSCYSSWKTKARLPLYWESIAFIVNGIFNITIFEAVSRKIRRKKKLFHNSLQMIYLQLLKIHMYCAYNNSYVYTFILYIKILFSTLFSKQDDVWFFFYKPMSVCSSLLLCLYKDLSKTKKWII